MKKHYSLITLAALLVALPASAASLIDVTTGGSGNVHSTVDVNGVRVSDYQSASSQGASADSSLHTTIKNVVNGTVNSNSADSDTQIHTDTHATVGVGTSAGGASATGTGNASAHANENALDNASAQAVFHRSDFSADSTGNAVVRVDPAQIATTTDLRMFAQSIIESDRNIDAVSFGGNSVGVDYKDHGRFIGVIPVVVTAHVIVDADGTVSVSYPWYDFLVVKNGDMLENDLDASIGQMVRANSLSTGTTTQAAWNARVMAEIAARLTQILQAHFEGSTTPSTATSTAR